MQTTANPPQTNLEPTVLMQMANSYWISQIIYVATKLDVFTKLDGKSLTLQEIAAATKTPPRTAERLLNACCALNLLQKKNSRYQNAPISQKFLVAGKEGSLGPLISLMGQLYSNWGRLLEAVQQDKCINYRFGEEAKISEEEVRFFTLAMHSNSSLSAPFLAAAIDLSKTKKLLDLGGGSGANAIALAEKNPQLEVVVYDFPAATKVAKEFISRSRANSRIKTLAGDFNKDIFPQGFDGILLSHILHGEGEEGSRVLLKKCYQSLKPSGKIIVVDFLLNEEKDGPVFPALFAVNMLIETPKGNTFSCQEIQTFLTESGFKLDSVTPLSGALPMTAIIATKPK